jgi:hypothetical protein
MLTVAKKSIAVAKRRHGIDALGKALIAIVDPAASKAEIDACTSHHFCNGVYAREYNLPATHVVVGRVHKNACFNIMLKGRMRIVCSETEARDVEAPQFFVSKAGEQKALYAYEDVTFITFHATDETDGAIMADILTVPTIEEFAQFELARLTHQEIDT